MGAELTPESAEVLEEPRGEDWDSGGGQESSLGSAGGQGLGACRGGARFSPGDHLGRGHRAGV